jgi:anti-sigma B factor antagonist
MQPEPFGVDVERRGKLLLLRLSGELDLASVESLEQAVRSSSDRAQEVAAVAIDLRDLEFIDSSGLRALLQTQDELAEKGRDREGGSGRGQVGEVFEVAGFGERLPTLDDPSELQLDSA